MSHINLSTFNIERLRASHEDAVRRVDLAKADQDAITAELMRRYGVQYAAILKASDRQSGELNGHVDGVGICYSVSKAVKWDSKKLIALANRLPTAIALKTFTVKASVAEIIFKALPPDLKAQVSEARTATYGEPTFKFAG